MEPIPASYPNAVRDAIRDEAAHLDAVTAESPTLFDLGEFLPAAEVKRRLKSKPKGPAWNARFGGPTKVVRIPEAWDREDLLERIEMLQSELGTVEADLKDAYVRGGGTLSNRFEKLAEFVAVLREVWPANDCYDPFAENSAT